MFVPIVHTKDKDRKEVEKMCARNFEKDTHTLLDAEKQVAKENREKDWFLEK